MRIAWIAPLVLLLGCGPKKPDSTAATTTSSSGPSFVSLEFDEDEEDWDMDVIKARAECKNLPALEPAAMMGKLDDPQINCLEDAIRDEPRQTYKKKVSLVLMADAWAKGDKERWAGVVARHLEKIDRSDPDLCYRYAIHLADKGAGKTDETIRWADVALENRSLWVGDTFVQRVNALYKIRTRAAMLQWQHLEEKRVRDDSLPEEEVDQARNRAKVMSREWLEYARTAGKDATLAQQMCEQAAGGNDYCKEDD